MMLPALHPSLSQLVHLRMFLLLSPLQALLLPSTLPTPLLLLPWIV